MKIKYFSIIAIAVALAVSMAACGNDVADDSILGVTESVIKDYVAPKDNINSKGFETLITAENAQASGTCGDNLNWYYKDDTLLIQGTGEMYDWSVSECPWQKYMDRIKTIIIKNGCTYIGSSAFANCNKLQDISMPNTLEHIGKYAFAGSSLAEVNIPNSVKNIEYRAFYNSDLKAVKISDGLTTIEQDVFFNCESLEDVSIPNSVTTIKARAFMDCKSLQNISIPNSVTTIEHGAFWGCTALKSVSLSEALTTIESGLFTSCTSLENISIPNGVTTIEASAFLSCTSLENLFIPDSVTSIGDFAFKGVSHIEYHGTAIDYGSHWGAESIN